MVYLPFLQLNLVPPQELLPVSLLQGSLRALSRQRRARHGLRRFNPLLGTHRRDEADPGGDGRQRLHQERHRLLLVRGLLQ